MGPAPPSNSLYPIKGYIYPFFNYCAAVTEGGGAASKV